jgi:protein SCO1/2
MRNRLIALCALLVALAVVAGCGDSNEVSASTAGQSATTADDPHAAGTTADEFEGGIVEPRRAAPPLRLRDIDGREVDLKDLRGAPVLVTFVYAQCPDVCPLIMQSLRQVRESSKLGRSLRVLAVSVDPEGDTPEVVRSFLTRQHVGFVDYLIGSRAELEPVWSDWLVGTEVPTDNPELIEHTALIYGITASGELATAYPVGFDPAAVARDLPLLART